MSNPSTQLPLQGCHVRVAKSQFWKDLTMLGKMSREQQMNQLRQWSAEMNVPSSAQTKPFPAFSVRSASLATDVCDEAVTAVAAANAASVSKCVGDIGDKEGKEAVDNGKKAVDNGKEAAVDNGKEAVDNGPTLVKDDHEVLQQIAKMEKMLLNIWEHGPAKLSEHQDTRILVLEEQLAIARSDSVYLESLLHVRDQDFARYCDLERRERIQSGHLARKVENLEAKLEVKDHLLNSMQAKLDCMREADRISQELIVRQKQLTKSTVALVSKQRKTKMADAHTVRYTTTKPRPLVEDEITLAERREWERKRLKQKDEIDTIVSTVDRIAANYDRYQNISTIITCSESRSEAVPDHLFTWVETDMIAMWLFSVEPTMEEQEKYERHLEKQIRPDPIYSPTLLKPRVNWSRLNTNMLRNLPIPVKYSMHGCAQSPEFYTSTKDVEHYGGQTLNTKLVFESGQPFGSLYGFWTSQGVMAPPEEAVHGYHCSPETGTWIIAAEGG